MPITVSGLAVDDNGQVVADLEIVSAARDRR
jgi:hypothetical protein